MGLYQKYILPGLIDWACRTRPSTKQRQKVIPLAEGNVLEIGLGSGLNLSHYDSAKVKNLVGVEPAIEVWHKKKVNPENLDFSFEFLNAFAEDLPLDTNSFDTVVVTYTLCSIKDTDKTFSEIRRVLKPNGKLIFNEHGKAPDPFVLKWQSVLDPVWQKFSGGCSLKKDIPGLIETAGFQFQSIDSMYIPGWRPASFNYWGVASVR
jgi:ubiquinone/menaquinone biosynthesis C-methylase UbiE